MFFLDVEPENSLSRIQGREEKEMFESMEELRKVREKALKLVKDWHIIDANRPINEIYEEIEAILDKLEGM